ncbi:MAG TPA: hypothetical protein VKM54_14815, partial [Myxococcota bacterium]|nr:hypothetical protein [Myxococcota bacterium]
MSAFGLGPHIGAATEGFERRREARGRRRPERLRVPDARRRLRVPDARGRLRVPDARRRLHVPDARRRRDTRRRMELRSGLRRISTEGPTRIRGPSARGKSVPHPRIAVWNAVTMVRVVLPGITDR